MAKAVELEPDSLPKRIYSTMDKLEFPFNEEDAIKRVLYETFLCDANQERLPKRMRVPYKGWHPVNSKMTSKVPYEVKFLPKKFDRVRYGLKKQRKHMNLIRGIFRHCAFIRPE